MSKLTKGLIIGGSVLGAAELINEGVGIFTNADAWYKGKFSVANGIKHILATTPEERKILTQKILDVIYSFPNLAKIHSSEEYKVELNKGANNNSNDEFLNLEILKNIPQGKNLNLDEVLSRVEIECSEDNNKLHCIEMAQVFCDFLDDKKVNEFFEHGKKRITANGFTLKDPESSLEVKYTVNSMIIDYLVEKEEEKDKIKEKINREANAVFIMNNDGSVTFEFKGEYSNGKLTDGRRCKFTLKPANKGIAKEV